MRLVTAALALPLLVLPLSALARPQHMDVKVKLTKCGATITCMARSDESAYTKAVVGLVPASRVKQVTRNTALQTQAKVTVQAPYNRAVPVTINLTYGSEFQPGQKFHVISAWPYGGSAHVWGAVMQTSTANEITLPGKMTPAMRAAAKTAADAAKVQLTALKGTQAAAKSALKAKQTTQLQTLKARHVAARDRLKQASAARRAKLDVKLAAAKGTPAAAAIRASIQAETADLRGKLAALDYPQRRALQDLKWRQEDARTDLQGKQSNAIAKLQAKLGI